MNNNSENNKIVGVRIKNMRLDNNWTQKDLAKKLGLKNETAIANYEAGYSIPKDEIKYKLCEVFNCTMDYLMGKSYYKNYEEFSKIDNFVLNYQRTVEESKLICSTLNYINTHKDEDIENIVNNAVKDLSSEEQKNIKKIIFHLHNTYHGNLPKTDAEIKQEFEFAYHKEAEGLTDEEIADAIRFYKQIKYGKKDENN